MTEAERNHIAQHVWPPLEPDDDPDTWDDDDIPVNIYGETEDENEDR